MTTDNRTNEPNQNETKSGQTFCFSEAQVEAAAKALEKLPLNLITRSESLDAARAALVAAQGAAPQAESERGDAYTCADLGHEDCGLRNHVAPVLPSSTVDEDALAEVIRKSENAWQKATGPTTRHEWIARAVAEWLKEQGR